MKKLLALLVLAVTSAAVPAKDTPIEKGSVVVVPLKGEVNEAQFFFLRRTLKEAENAQAAAFLIDMDTYGGSLKSAVDMLDALMKTTVPTLTYVNTNAGSAGALIALSTKRIYMAPVSAIGAAAPVSSEGEDLKDTMNAKIVSYFSGYFRSAAEKNGYSPELAEAFINKEKEVKIGDVVINPKGSLLTLSSQEATKIYNGHPLLAVGVAPSLEDLCRQAGLDPARIAKVEPSGFEILAQWITALAPLFLLGGIVGAYLEFKAPGFGIAGVLSALCFLLFFTGHYIAGLAGFEVMAVFVVGIIFVVIEMILFPGIMLLVTAGLVLMVGAMLFAMVDFYPARGFTFSADMFVYPVLQLSLALALAVVAIALLARFFPQLPFFRRLILATNQDGGESLVETAPHHRLRVGDEGVARSILRPAGKAEIAGEFVDVTADGEFIESGAAVRVLRVEGSRIVVASV